MKLDILAFGAHPDDVELTCGATVVKEIKNGKKVGIADLTRGELGSRGSAEIRAGESAKASEILGISVRENLGFKDGFFENNEEHQRKIISLIRQYRPEIVLATAIYDRHPDHARASGLISASAFLSGLIKIETTHNGQLQSAWRPKAVCHYIQDKHIHPDFVVDVTGFTDQKFEAIMAYKSQFYNSNDDSIDPQTPISSMEFLEFLKARMREHGRLIQTEFGEGFTMETPVKIKNLEDLL